MQASEALNPGVFGENLLPERPDRVFEPGFKRFGDDETSANRLVGGYFLGFFKQLHGDKHFVDFELPEGLSAAAWRAAAPFSVLETDRFGEFLRSPLLRLDLCAFRPFGQRLLHPRKSLPQGAVDQKGLAKIDNLGLPFYRCDKLRCESYIGAAIKMDNIYVLEEETKEIALDKRTRATRERQEKMRRIADLYVAEIEIEGKALSSIVEEAGVKAWTIQRWKRDEKCFIDLLVEARMRIGQSVGGLPFTTLKGQIEKYAGILQQATADNNGRLEVECLKEISRLSGLDRTKTIEEIEKDDRNSKEQLRSQLLGMVERARSYHAGDSAKEFIGRG